MKKITLLIVALFFVTLFGCEKEPLPPIVVEVLCYDCYKRLVEEVVTYDPFGNIIEPRRTVVDTERFITKLCVTPDKMKEIEYVLQSVQTVQMTKIKPPLDEHAYIGYTITREYVECRKSN